MNGANEHETIGQQAADWLLASLGDAMDWDAFTRWLEADPRHRTAYDEIAMADDLVARHAAAIVERENLAANDDQPARRPRWPLWAGGAVAASLVALLVVPEMTAPAEQVYATGAAGRTIALADGSRIELAPRSRLTVSGAEQSAIDLQGGAYFAIRHDPGRKLVISAGDLAISDIGTVFDVQADAGTVRVEVTSGQVAVSGSALAVPVNLAAGRRFTYDPASTAARTEPVATEDVGEWREGRLTFDNAPLALVGTDLARYAGVHVAISPVLAQHRFSGTLSIDDGDAAIRDLAQLMDLRLVGDPGDRRLEPAR